MPNMTNEDPGLLYCMFKGEPGTRKSTQALGYPKPQYWFSWDRKMSGLIIPMRNWKIDPTQIDYDDYENWNAARTKMEGFQTTCKYKTIVVDSLTSMADMTLRQTLKSKGGVTRASGAAAGRVISGISVNEIEDYGAEAAAIQELVALTKDIHKYHKITVILIAHVVQAEYKSPAGVTHFSRQIITAGKKVAPKIPAYCGEVYHFDIDSGLREGSGGDYCLYTEHTGDDFARTALPLPNKIVLKGEDNLYDLHVKPAIEKLRNNPPDIRVIK